uniref:U5 small nuclear ribonucleoprotein TSSC4-like n=1 Tax=Myxine glutinosa TaxID=7769 RepID=UPI00358F32D4
MCDEDSDSSSNPPNLELDPLSDDLDEFSQVTQDQKQPENPALDLDEADNSSPRKRSPSKKLFHLQGGSEAFCSRSMNIFSGLESAARTTLSFLGDDNVLDGTFKRPPSSLVAPKMRKLPKDVTKDKDRGMQKCMKLSSEALGNGDDLTETQDDVVDESTPLESFRNLPEPVLQTPGYLVNPARWKCYSLENEKDGSDGENAAVALGFILSAKHPDEMDGVERECRRVLFNAWPRRESGSKGQQDAGQFGSKASHTKKQQIVNEKQALSLQHLSHSEQDEQQWPEYIDEGDQIGVDAKKGRRGRWNFRMQRTEAITDKGEGRKST